MKHCSPILTSPNTFASSSTYAFDAIEGTRPSNSYIAIKTIQHAFLRDQCNMMQHPLNSDRFQPHQVAESPVIAKETLLRVVESFSRRDGIGKADEGFKFCSTCG